MDKKNLGELICDTLEELTTLLSFMVDCEDCPLEHTCKNIPGTDLCETLLKKDGFC